MYEDIHIMKTYGNAFNKTNLEKTLKELNVDTIILTGFVLRTVYFLHIEEHLT